MTMSKFDSHWVPYVPGPAPNKYKLLTLSDFCLVISSLSPCCSLISPAKQFYPNFSTCQRLIVKNEHFALHANLALNLVVRDITRYQRKMRHF